MSTLERVAAGRTRVEFRHYYSIRGWKAWLFHWIAGRSPRLPIDEFDPVHARMEFGYPAEVGIVLPDDLQGGVNGHRLPRTEWCFRHG